MKKIIPALSLLLPIIIVSIVLILLSPTGSLIHSIINTVISSAAGILVGFGCLFFIALLVLMAKSGLELLFKKKST
jgi:threonine/homoserine/homoserine lactone efflux protein